MPCVCSYCSSVFFPSIHRKECPDCGFWFTGPLDEDESFILCISCGEGIDDGTPFTRYCEACQTIEDNKEKESN